MLKKLFYAVLILCALLFLFVMWFFMSLPNTAAFRTTNPKASAIQQFREEQVRKKGGKPRSSMQWRNLNQISPYLRHAVVLSEDDTFFTHAGFDVEQMKRAIQVNWERKKYVFGASTITQQLARSLYLSPKKNLWRKLREALITRRLEKNLSKNRILELYLNIVEWGPQVYGAEAAAQHFFSKSAADLSVDEAIALAVILPSPRRYNPLSEKGYIARQKAILYDRMVRAHYVIPNQTPDQVTEQPLPEDSLDAEERNFDEEGSDMEEASEHPDGLQLGPPSKKIPL